MATNFEVKEADPDVADMSFNIVPLPDGRVATWFIHKKTDALIPFHPLQVGKVTIYETAIPADQTRKYLMDSAAGGTGKIVYEGRHRTIWGAVNQAVKDSIHR